MKFTTLISNNELAKHLTDSNWAIIDCRFLLAEPDKSEADYLQSHIPGAIYAHLDRDMCGEIVPGVTGRHPLPSIERAGSGFSKMGIGPSVQVVTYDDKGGALAAGRLWWMLRWLGHEAVAVLDGGWGKWLAEGRETESGAQSRKPVEFTATPRPALLASAEQVDQVRQNPRQLVIDARATERYRGEFEPIDTVAGHIPGAVNAPHQLNLNAEGMMKPAEQLRARYQALIREIPAEETVTYCGSGVTAIHNILAMQHAGLGESRLYAGSWSEWIIDPNRPVVKS